MRLPRTLVSTDPGRGRYDAVARELCDGLLPEPAVTITMTDEERAAAMAAVHAATCRRRGVPPLPQWFLALPALLRASVFSGQEAPTGARPAAGRPGRGPQSATTPAGRRRPA